MLTRLEPLLSDPGHGKLGHHLKYDAHVLRNHGIELRGMRYDSMLESYVLNSTATRHDLDSVARHYLGVETIHYEDVAGKGAKQIPFDQVPVERAAEYSAEDADVSLRLHRALWPQIEGLPPLRQLYEEIEQPLVPVLLDMEHLGVLIDTAMLRKQGHEIAKSLLALEQSAHAIAGVSFNLDSPKQLQEVLFDKLELPVKRKTADRAALDGRGRARGTGGRLRAAAADPRVPRPRASSSPPTPTSCPGRSTRAPGACTPPTTRRWRPPDGCPPPTRTCRTSRSAPPEGRRIRQAFIAPPGHVLMAADYSQIELRIMAHLSGDAGLLKAFAEDRDIHQATAAEVFGLAAGDVTPEQRRAAKAINFGLIYGMSAFGLARQLGIDRGAAQQLRRPVLRPLSGREVLHGRHPRQAREQGFVETVFGRRLYLPDISSRNQQLRQYAERSAINAPMQGTAADIIKRAMIEVRCLAAARAARTPG